MALPFRTVKLASGYEMPLVGLSLWKIPKETTADNVYEAIKISYRLFNRAYNYQNKGEAGEGIQQAINKGLVNQEDIFITTKLWNNYHYKEYTIDIVKSQNKAWGLRYFNLLFIHFPCTLKYIDPKVRKYPISYTL